MKFIYHEPCTYKQVFCCVLLFVLLEIYCPKQQDSFFPKRNFSNGTKDVVLQQIIHGVNVFKLFPQDKTCSICSYIHFRHLE